MVIKRMYLKIIWRQCSYLWTISILNEWILKHLTTLVSQRVLYSRVSTSCSNFYWKKDGSKKKIPTMTGIRTCTKSTFHSRFITWTGPSSCAADDEDIVLNHWTRDPVMSALSEVIATFQQRGPVDILIKQWRNKTVPELLHYLQN